MPKIKERSKVFRFVEVVTLLLLLLTDLSVTANVEPIIVETTDPSMIGYWTADGTANDISGNGHHGTVHGGVVYGEGKFGQAFSLDGTSGWVQLGSNDAFNFGTSDFTVSFWIKFKTLSSIQGRVAQILIEKFRDSSSFASSDFLNSTTSRGWTIYKLNGVNGRIETYAYSQGASSSSFTPSVTQGQWHQLVVTRLGQVLKYFFDGSLEYTHTSFPTNISDSDVPMLLGRRSDDRTFFANALFDDIKVYNRALSAAEVGNSYLSSSAPSTAPSFLPTVTPTSTPSEQPTFSPSVVPSISPSLLPTVVPSTVPSDVQTRAPTLLYFDIFSQRFLDEIRRMKNCNKILCVNRTMRRFKRVLRKAQRKGAITRQQRTAITYVLKAAAEAKRSDIRK